MNILGSNSPTPQRATGPRFGIHVGTLLGLIALMVLGLWGFREYFSPARVWQRTIHDPSRVSKAWMEVEREHLIDGLDAPSTLKEVFEAMNDPDPTIKGWAVWCLPSLEADPVVVIDRLSRLLADQDLSVRVKAVEALGQVFKRGKAGRAEALGALEIALKDADAKVRRATLGSIGQVVYESGQSADPLRSGQPNDPALNLVASRLTDTDIAVRVEAAFVLGCNDRGVEAVPMLVKFLREQPVDAPLNYVANRAFMALTILAVRSAEAVAFLNAEIGVEREGYPDRPRDALAWAARQTPEAHMAVRKKAREGLKSDDLVIRFQAAFLMHDIGLGVEALDPLIEALQDESLDYRIRAVEAIADIGEADARALAALQAATNDPEIEVRGRALGALEAIELEKMQ
jgi:HEAT repeat protein